MSEIKHTPTPWTKDRHEQLRGADGRAVNVWGLGIGWASRDDETEGNSELIIDAVNSHASLTAERDRLREALIASRNAHAELAEFLLGDGGSAVKSDVLKGMFADLQRARLAADAALEPRS